MQVDIPKLLTITEVCEILGRCRASIYNDVKAKRLPRPLKIGGSIKWKTSDILAALDRFTQERDAAGGEQVDLVEDDAA